MSVVCQSLELFFNMLPFNIFSFFPCFGIDDDVVVRKITGSDRISALPWCDASAINDFRLVGVLKGANYQFSEGLLNLHATSSSCQLMFMPQQEKSISKN